jgi:hypothetical protein
MKPIKFASQVDAKVLRDLRAYAEQNNRSISSVVTEALAEYLAKAQIRPAFQTSMEEVLVEHSELLSRLAK